MLSNGATHLANNVFLSVVRDDVDHAFLFTDDDIASHAPVSLLNLSRAVQFDIQVDGVAAEQPNCSESDATTIVKESIKKTAINSTTARTAALTTNANSKPTPSTHGNPSTSHVVEHPQLLTSSNGMYAIAIGPFQRRHVLLHVPRGEVAELLLPHAVISCVWHPHEGHVLFLLGVDGSVTAVDVSWIRHHVAPRLLATISAVEIHQALFDRTLLAQRRHHHTSSKLTPPSSTDAVNVQSEVLVPVSSPSLAAAAALLPSSSMPTTSSATSAKEAAASIHFVALSIVAETPGLPTMLLILSSRGDIISVKIGGDFHPACDATMAARLHEREHLQELGYVSPKEATELALLGSWEQQPLDCARGASAPGSGRLHSGKVGGGVDVELLDDGTLRRRDVLSDDVLGRTTVFALAAGMNLSTDTADDQLVAVSDGHNHPSASPINALFCVHHVVQPTVDDALNEPNDYAVSLAVHVVDAHAGLHCVNVLHTSGELRGYLLHERDLLSVDLRKHRHEHVVRFSDAPIAPSVAPPATQRAARDEAPWKGGERLRRILQEFILVSSNNLLLVKSVSTPRNNFLVVYPLWHSTKVVSGEGYIGEWIFYEPHRQGCSLLPSPGYDSCSPPAPLATRIPLDMSHYSVALGDDGLLMMFPDRVRAHADCNKEHTDKKQLLAVIGVPTVELFLSALYAQQGSVAILPDTTSAAPESSQRRDQALINDCIMLASSEHRGILVDGGFDDVPAAASSSSSAALEEKVGQVFDNLHHKEQLAREKREQLAAKLQGLQGRIEAAGEKATKMKDLLLEALYSREGLDEVYRTNNVLGQIKTALTELENVISWRGEQGDAENS